MSILIMVTIAWFAGSWSFMFISWIPGFICFLVFYRWSEGILKTPKVDCSKCVFLRYHHASFDSPYGEVWCGQGHWDGFGPDDPSKTILRECKDYKEK